MIGIYGIHNIANNKWYVGQSQDIRKRLNGHKNLLKKNQHHNKHLQRSYNQYGETSFEYEILELCTIDELDDLETKWIDVKMSKKNGYNMTNGGGGTRGFHLAEETKEKIRKGNIGIRAGVPRPEHIANILRTNGIGKASVIRKPVRCVETQEVFASIEHAAKAVGRSHATLSVACKEGRTCAGYHWEYYTEEETPKLKEVS